MSQNSRKLIGMLLLVTLVILYALIATTVAVAKLADASGWVHMLYFFFTGLLWIIPAMFIIKWMLRPDEA